MPWIYFVVFIVGDLIAIPCYEWYLLFARRRQIAETGFANYFHLCGMMQLALIILVVRQLWNTIEDMFKNVQKCKL
jgi:hypothetical protein